MMKLFLRGVVLYILIVFLPTASVAGAKFDPNARSASYSVLSPSQRERDHYRDVEKSKKGEINAYYDLNELLRVTAGKLSNACDNGTEDIFIIYSYMGADGRRQYYSKRPFWQKGDAVSASAKAYLNDMTMGVEATMVGSMHNHPSENSHSSAWFSNMDVISALMTGDEFTAVTDCWTREILKLNIKEIEGGSYPLVYFLDRNNHDDVKARVLSDDGNTLCFDSTTGRGEKFDICAKITRRSDLEGFTGTYNEFSEKFGRDAFSGSNFSALKALAKRFVDGNIDGNANLKSVASVATEEDGNASLPVGIRGWCKCLDRQETCGAKSIEVGAGRDWIGKPGYSYRFCLCCGRCRRPPEKVSDADDIKIIDREFYWKVQTAKDDVERNRLIKECLDSLGVKAGDGDTTREGVVAMAAAQIKLMKIPDGQIVVPGKCKCKTPDPINSGYHPEEQVCVKCGKYCENPSGKIGSTAMRLMKEGR